MKRKMKLWSTKEELFTASLLHFQDRAAISCGLDYVSYSRIHEFS